MCVLPHMSPHVSDLKSKHQKEGALKNAHTHRLFSTKKPQSSCEALARTSGLSEDPVFSQLFAPADQLTGELGNIIVHRVSVWSIDLQSSAPKNRSALHIVHQHHCTFHLKLCGKFFWIPLMPRTTWAKFTAPRCLGVMSWLEKWDSVRKCCCVYVCTSDNRQ